MVQKSFYEPSARIPLIINAPWMAPSRVDELVSLVDLLPTFMGLATGGPWKGAIEPLEGTDLTTLVDGEGPARTVYCEYLADAITASIFMIQRGPYKFISSSTDPVLLFDVEADPDERDNLASRLEFSSLVAEFEADVRIRPRDHQALRNRRAKSGHDLITLCSAAGGVASTTTTICWHRTKSRQYLRPKTLENCEYKPE